MNLELFESFSNDLEEATVCYVIWNRLQNAPASDEALLGALNRTPLAWKVFRETSRITFFICMGRIFDCDTASASITELIESCISRIDEFSIPSLRARKIAMGTDAAGLERCLEKAHEPRRAEFERLKDEILRYRDIFKMAYKPLRNKRFAHRDKPYISREQELWQKVALANAEEMLNFLSDVELTLYCAYHEGRAPCLQNREFDRDWFEKDINELLRTIRLAPAPPPAAPRYF